MSLPPVPLGGIHEEGADFFWSTCRAAASTSAFSLDGQLARQGADALWILAPSRPRDPIRHHRIGLSAGRPPGLDVLRVETLRAAVGAQRRGIQRARRQHHGERLGAGAAAGSPAFTANVRQL